MAIVNLFEFGEDITELCVVDYCTVVVILVALKIVIYLVYNHNYD